jgi:peptide/nickel transport system permease protein
MVAIVVSFVLRLMPADPAAIIAGDNATAAQIAAVRDKLGLSRPILSSS